MDSLSVTLAGAGAFAAGVYAIVALIRRVLRIMRDALEVSVPVQPSQRIEFLNPGEKCLHIEGPLFTMRFGGLAYELVDEATGMPVPLRMVWFRAKSSGWKRARLMLKRCTIPHAGSYVLTIRGMSEGFDASGLAIVFTKPYMAPMIATILGLVFSGFLVIASIVFTALALTHVI
jgi:hypothetical protein